MLGHLQIVETDPILVSSRERTSVHVTEKMPPLQTLSAHHEDRVGQTLVVVSILQTPLCDIAMILIDGTLARFYRECRLC